VIKEFARCRTSPPDNTIFDCVFYTYLKKEEEEKVRTEKIDERYLVVQVKLESDMHGVWMDAWGK
jgi:hypothetical protein